MTITRTNPELSVRLSNYHNDVIVLQNDTGIKFECVCVEIRQSFEFNETSKDTCDVTCHGYHGYPGHIAMVTASHWCMIAAL